MCSTSCCAPATEEPDLGDVPPSVRTVYRTLGAAGPLTQKELVERTDLANRTVRSALRSLVDSGHVAEELHLPDLRQREYVIAD